ncbi:hypothetical protein LSTR_LSTR012063 [Laodelphax striatellus]|uniref:Uncharacterized protein n=1 Tax=Laodelphax striatellus TaxID=195883 RepID=A0A482WQ70_LAOST|nr:hypothetical protein LSTR_LSTR012063 [Laodelphax striatellus]
MKLRNKSTCNVRTCLVKSSSIVFPELDFKTHLLKNHWYLISVNKLFCHLKSAH